MRKTVNEIMLEVHGNAVAHGFHPANENVEFWFANMCNNLHGEVNEMWDAHRAGQLHELCDKSGKMEALGLRPLTCLEEEMADIIIRTLDMAARMGVDIEAAVEIKHQFNLTRPFKHGKKN